MEMGSGASLEPISAPGGACSRCEAGERRGLFGCCGPSGCAPPLPPRSATPPSAGDPREVLLSSPDTLHRHLETSLWGAASDRRGWRRKPRPLPPPSFSLWVAGDGGPWEENYRYHRLAGSLVSSAEPMEEFRPLIPREAPRGQAQGPRCHSGTWPMAGCWVRGTSCSISHHSASGTGQMKKRDGGG
ncbi:uncharacterized protein LOC120381088 isoform X2 [Mauremys reevesii]|uniref:uncharacterized protein LOC120381088 isoform X2 n=1 Tax=Mauremys reevesii TaxID=260615 RepID=UPI00193F633A|nr:uncharacterized protein LOC120381088 isoform X2 [Mauremys reevesii]